MQFVFIIGTGRCGSTRLAQVVAAHGDVGFVSNLEERLPRLSHGGLDRAVIGAANRSPRLQRAREMVGPTEAYGLLDREVSSMIAVPCRDLVADDAMPWIRKRFRTFFESRATAQAKPVFLHKFTGWPRARFIDAIFPDAKFVHLVRDGRAVANSLMQVPFWQGYRGPTEWSFGPLPEADAEEWERSGRSFALLAGLEWKLLMDAFDEAERAIPAERWLNLRYEDFVVDPRRELERVLAFAGLGWTAAVERQLEDSRIVATREQAYLHELAPRDIDLLNRALAGPLERWGYVDGPGATAVPEADALRGS